MKIKFPTRNGVGEEKRDQKMARSCYFSTLRPGEIGGQVLPIEDTDIWDDEERRGKPAEELVVIPLNMYDPKKVTYIGASLKSPLKERLIKFLQENKDVFARTAADMSWIDLELITHKLNVIPDREPVKQKKRSFAPERKEAIKQEVEKLLKAGVIEEIHERHMNSLFAINRWQLNLDKNSM